MNRGDEQPMNEVMPLMRSSCCNARRTESQMASESAMPLPSGRKISTAN